MILFPFGRDFKSFCLHPLHAGKVSQFIERVVLQKAVPLAKRETRFGCSHWTHCYTSQQLVQEPSTAGQSYNQPSGVRNAPSLYTHQGNNMIDSCWNKMISFHSKINSMCYLQFLICEND